LETAKIANLILVWAATTSLRIEAETHSQNQEILVAPLAVSRGALGDR